MPILNWPRLLLYLGLSGLSRATGLRATGLRATGLRATESVPLPFKGVTACGLIGQPNGLKFLIEIVGYDVYVDLDTDTSEVFYDIGANCGYLAISRCLRNSTLRAWCFEPRSESLLLLRRNIQLNRLQDRISVVEGAVSDVDGTVELGLPVGSSKGILGGHNLSWMELHSQIADHAGVPGPLAEKPLLPGRALAAGAWALDSLRLSRPRSAYDRFRIWGWYSFGDSSQAKSELGYRIPPLAESLAATLQPA